MQFIYVKKDYDTVSFLLLSLISELEIKKKTEIDPVFFFCRPLKWLHICDDLGDLQHGMKQYVNKFKGCLSMTVLFQVAEFGYHLLNVENSDRHCIIFIELPNNGRRLTPHVLFLCFIERKTKEEHIFLSPLLRSCLWQCLILSV